MQRLHPRTLPLLTLRSFYEAWQTSKQYLLLFAGAGVALANTEYGMLTFAILLAVVVTFVTLKQYQHYMFDIGHHAIELRHGVFKHTKLTIHKDHVERFEIKTGLFERLLGLQTIFLFTSGSASPAMTLSYLTTDQAEQTISALDIQSVSSNQSGMIKARWWAGVLLGPYYPYLTLGIILVIPIFLALNIIHSPPTANPGEAKAAITDTIDMGLIPLLVNIALMVPFYVFICLIGKCASFAYQFSLARFHIDDSGQIVGETGLFNRHSWTMQIRNIQYFKVDTLPILERLGRYNVTIMPVAKAENTMLIPGIDKQALDKILTLKSISHLDRSACITPSYNWAPIAILRTFLLFVLPIYAAIVYMLPDNSLETLTINSHTAIVCILFTLTIIWSTISHRNNRIDRQDNGVIVGARTFSRSYYCFSNEDIKSHTSIAGDNLLNAYSSTSYQLGHKRITASFTRHL
jgi:membrane protein YdbS with pleckstrin-like domain